MEKTTKEINWEFKQRQNQERHETFRLFLVTFGIVTVLCSIIWGITIYSLEEVKHPVQYDYKKQTDVNYERK